MSGLIGLLVPGLLMLASLGLARLESGLRRHTLQPNEVSDFLDQAGPRDMTCLAQNGLPSAMESLHRRQLERIEPSLEAIYEATASGHTQQRFEPKPMRSRHSAVDSLRAGGAAV